VRNLLLFNLELHEPARGHKHAYQVISGKRGKQREQEAHRDCIIVHLTHVVEVRLDYKLVDKENEAICECLGTCVSIFF
jgi:hypothetical protein